MRHEYSEVALQKILDFYPNFGSIAKMTLFTSGFENTNYLIETDRGRQCVIKIFEADNIRPETIIFEIEVMNALAAASVRVPCVIKRQDSSFHTTISNKTAIVMEYIAGENQDMNSSLTDRVIAEVGTEMAKMDVTLKAFPDNGLTRQNYEWDLKNFLQLEKACSLLSSPIDREICQAVFDAFKKIQPAFLSTTRGLIHNDVGAHNIIVSDNDLQAIIDFSDIAYSPYIQNLAVTLAQMIFSTNWAPPQTTIFLREYLAVHPLPKSELPLLYDLVLARYVTNILGFTMLNIRFGEDQDRSDATALMYRCLNRFRDFGRTNFALLLP